MAASPSLLYGPSASISSESASLAFIPYNPTVVSHVLAGILGAFVWDLFSNTGYDYELLCKWPIELPAATYFISRISNLIFSIAILLFSVTTDTAHCTKLATVEKWSIVIAVSSTSLLFFWRVRAVYQDNRIVCGFFFLTWLAVSCACLLHTQVNVFTLDVKKIEQAGRCFTIRNSSAYVTVSRLVSMTNDLLIFCAITYRLTIMAEVADPTPQKRAMVAVFGRHLPAFSRTLLQDGQAYFLPLVPIYTFAIVCSASYPSKISRYSIVIALPSTAFSNLMACKIYRKTRLGIHTASDTDISLRPFEAMAFNRSFPSFIRQVDADGRSLANDA
ncbi:hypothetical protein HYPSUDRAFT_44208 [Hypholoma sublateritium FD-334 SS-4]|uniref:Uncharacterized protein n=1 Tax=Hypholoma sublateritium (strain FD-334 SS-4) TaxID=945553 RepID=A0A0D2PH86_HYPSF|nr:hypothetical protein HYPSUDRAFT_44208 [Hypholoma sublateritium FD-334 SS-4]